MKKPQGRPLSGARAPRAAQQSEQDVFIELQALCTRPGYVHALAFLCFRDNMLLFAERLTEEDMRHSLDPSRLLRTEVNTLIGLMAKMGLRVDLVSAIHKASVAIFIPQKLELKIVNLAHGLTTKRAFTPSDFLPPPLLGG